jgi:hypothetical protein
MEDCGVDTERPIPPVLEKPQPMGGRAGLVLSLLAPTAIGLLWLLRPG